MYYDENEMRRRLLVELTTRLNELSEEELWCVLVMK
jgi:hypothetical protein